MQINDDVIKEEFEKWAKEHKFILTKDKSTVDENGELIYANPMTQGAWMAFDYAMDLAVDCIRSDLDLDDTAWIH